MEPSTENNATPVDAVASPSAAKGVAVGAGVGAGVGVGVWGVVAPVIHWIGFGASGIATGSTAASMMSAAAIANGGGVAAGSTVAVLQNVGAVGLATSAGLGLVATGVVIGGAAVGAKAYLGGRGSGVCSEEPTEKEPANTSQSASWLQIKWPSMAAASATTTTTTAADAAPTRSGGSESETRDSYYKYFSSVKKMLWRSDETANEAALQSKL